MCQVILGVFCKEKHQITGLQLYGIKGVYIHCIRQCNCYYVVVIVELTLVSSTVADCYAEIWTTSDLPQPQNTRTECFNPQGMYCIYVVYDGIKHCLCARHLQLGEPVHAGHYIVCLSLPLVIKYCACLLCCVNSDLSGNVT